jgi:hypothetical protein
LSGIPTWSIPDGHHPDPLSDLISALALAPVDDAVLALHRAFLVARVGVNASTLPAHARGAYQSTGEDWITMSFVMTADGRTMVKACADLRVFDERYPGAITCEMVGRHMLEMVLKVPELQGVLLCSAASFHSVPLGRAAIPDLLAL